MFFSQEDNVFELLGVFMIERGKYYNKNSRMRTYDSLSIRLSGYCDFGYKNRNCRITPNGLLYIPQNADYSQITDGETIIAVHFLNYSSAGKNDFEFLPLENPEEFSDIILDMYNIWNEKAPGYKSLCTSLLYRIIYMANRQMSLNAPSGNPDTAITDAVGYIHKHYKSESISVAELARMSSVSETYFRRLFKRIYLVSPSQYIINLKLEYASQLLSSKLYTVGEVSEKSGFNDVKYFSRLFKKRYGQTPGKYPGS